MSRFKRFAHSLASGYVLLVANMLYTLASVPLALHYLSKAEFGLWALATKLSVFIALVDFGLSASVARILIDHKDDRASGQYGAIIKTGFLVGAVQGLLVLLVGTVLAFYLGPLLEIDPRLQPELQWLLTGQCAMLAVSFAARTFNHLLTAHQRFDIANYTQTLLFPVAFAVTWFAFSQGQGVFSILWAYALTTVVQTAVNWLSCVRLKLLPRPGEWGALTWPQFKSVFVFGSDIFLFSLGALLITASQTILLTRLLGLETVTVWNICTRGYDVLQQVIYRIFDYSSSALAEMIVRGEKILLAARFRQIVTLSASLSVAAGTMFAVCNSSFVTLWTAGRFESPKLVAGDVKEPRRLAAQLQQGESMQVQFLWQQFSPEARAQIAQLTGAAESDEALSKILAGELDRVVAGAPLAARPEFAAAKASGSADELATAWANRHALEDAFPLEIADSRKARWSSWNDLLLAIWLVICVSLHSHTGLVGQAKAFRFMRYIFFLEGLAFVGLTVLLYRHGGITAMLVVSIGCSLAFSFAYGLYRTRQYFGLSRAELAGWHRAPLRLPLWLLPVAALVAWATQPLPPLPRLALNAGVVGAWGLFALSRYGLEPALQQELLKRVSGSIRRWMQRLLGMGL